MGKILNLVNKAVGLPATKGEVVHVDESTTAEEALSVLSKEARKALRETGVWNQAFHDSEIVSLIAIYLATKSYMKKKDAALAAAIEFIGQIESDTEYKDSAREALLKINIELMSDPSE